MFLVDTSVWIETFRKRKPPQLTDFVHFEEIVTCLPVIQEVLQGFRDELAFRHAREAMLAMPRVESPITQDLYEEAIALYRGARRSGFTVRSSVDCLIAAAAIRHNLTILHRDRDFPLLARISELHEKSI